MDQIYDIKASGVEFKIFLPQADTDYIQGMIAKQGVPYEHEMLRDMKSRVTQDDLVIDVGANIGNHTLFLAASGCKVLALEPNASLSKALEKSIAFNGWIDRVSILDKAAGENEGVARFSETNTANLGAMSLEVGVGDIQLVTLDGLQLQKLPSLIKIDVEGMELDVLRGASGLIKNARPLIYVECLDQHQFREIFNWMSGADYVYWDTFNASPTHLFIPAEKTTANERAARIQFKDVFESYRTTIQLNRLRRQVDDERNRIQASEREMTDLKLKYLVSKELLDKHVEEVRSFEQNIGLLKHDVKSGLDREEALKKLLHEHVGEVRGLEQNLRLLKDDVKSCLDREKACNEKMAMLDGSLKSGLEREAEYKKKLSALEHKLKIAETKKTIAEKNAKDTKKTITYQLGSAIMESTKSLRGFLRLPIAMLHIQRESKRRKKAKSGKFQASKASSVSQIKNLRNKKLYDEASRMFYHNGILTDTQAALDDLLRKGVRFDEKQRNFKSFISGMLRLKSGFQIPPRQPNPGFLTRNRHLLYCLHQSVPHATNGYSTRSHGIATGLKHAGWNVRAATRTGFPWCAGVAGLKVGCHQSFVDGVTYAAASGWNINNTPLDYYLAENADHYLREAQTSGAEIIVAASNHITALPALMAARRLGLPFVYEVRGLWEVTQASTQPEWANSERYHLMRKLEQQAVREADLVITLTEELAGELASWGVERQRIVLAPNAVDVDRFMPAEPDASIADQLGLKSGVPVIGYAGSAVAYEGLELLLEALALLKKQGEDFIFVLVGDGKVMDMVKARAQALDLHDRCRFTGRVPFEEVPRYLSCMEIMPVPRLSSAVTEMVSALKPLEAMAMGKAVVLSDVSPHKTMAGNNERARLFLKDDSEDLARSLRELMHDPKERERLGMAARAWVVQERSWKHVTAAYAQALEQVRSSVGSLSATGSEPKTLDQITFGLIADQFTTDTLASAVKVLPLSPDNWKQELAEKPIDVLFVESAWKGNNGQWHRKVGHYSDEEFAPLEALLAYCREQGIPSLFWNKEDPVHFERFIKAASLCDHVFTTDSWRIIPYLATSGARTKTSSSCPFYASPKIHNLLPSTRAWQPTAAYGGTYYGARYPERTEYMDKIMSAAAPLGLTIYDRQHADPASPYKYPSGLGGYVAGGLSYEEMIQAYKAHPVQINVNSVLDSPTMFSRRVVEVAACGVPLISGPALGMNRYLEAAAQVIHTESEAAQALENLLHHPAYRWRVALRGARAVMRTHTTQHRLTQMLRTAGLVIQAPRAPRLNVWVQQISEEGARRLLAQSLRPQVVYAASSLDDSKQVLEAAGIPCHVATDISCDPGSLWLLAESKALGELEDEDFEDLAWASAWAPQPRIAFKRDTAIQGDEWPGVALETENFDPCLQLLRAPQASFATALADWAATQPTLALRKPPVACEQAPNIPPQKTLLIAGHDLKFIKPFYPYFTRAGIRILLDFWSGHSQHNEAISKRLIGQADTVFCEWMLGNAIWYGQHKSSGQKLVGRLHAQELRSALFEKVPCDKFETVIFVGPHMLRQAKARNPAIEKNGVVIYNGVDVEALQAVPRKPTNGKVLGFVGMVPQSKRIDLALDILRELRKDDDGYILKIKGKRPEDFSWMANRPDEMAWYQEQYRRLKEDPLLKGAVIFDPHGNDMPEWYAGVDYVLSTSDFESFHFTIADGAAAGCVPVVLPWEGADEIYPGEWVHSDEISAAQSIKGMRSDNLKMRKFAKTQFDISAIAQSVIKAL
jgi:FkbM family methyltransferase